MGVTINLAGVNELQKRLKRLNINAAKEVSQVTKKAVLNIERKAKKYAPVDTGRLRSSITPYVKDTEGEVSTNVEYALNVEIGTANQKAQPYMAPAANEIKPEYQREVNEALKKAGRYERL